MSLRKKNLSKIETRKQLTVQVIEAKGLGIKKSEQSVFCVVSCNRVLFQTKRTEKSGKLEWNETFSFKEVDINEKTSEVRIVIFVVDKQNKETILGEVSINISQLTPNTETKTWYNIKNKTHGSNKGKLLVETFLFSEFKNVTKKNERATIGEFFKRKLSWGGKQGSQIISRPSPVSSSKYPEEMEFADTSNEDANKSSKHYDIYDSNSANVYSGSDTSEKDADDRFNRDIIYQDETDFEDAFSTPNVSTQLSITEDENASSLILNGSQNSDASSVRISRRKKRKEKKIKILDVIDENPPDPVNEDNKVNDKGKEDNDKDFKEIEVIKTDSANVNKKNDNVNTLIKPKKRPSFFSRQSFVKLFKSVKKTKEPPKKAEQVEKQNNSTTIDKEDQSKKPKQSKVILIEDKNDHTELQSHANLKMTLKEYFSSGKVFLRHVKRLNNDFIVPGIKRDITEFGKIFECIQKFIYMYKPPFREALKKMDDENWRFGKYFLNLHKFFDDEIRKYRTHQLYLSVIIDTEIDKSPLKQFIESHGKQRKDNVNFSDLLLSPIHHLYSITHIIERISLTIPDTHSEYSDIIKASKLFTKLVKELTSITPETKDINEDILALEKSIQFSPTILKFNISNGKRTLIKQGRFQILKLENGAYKRFDVYGILFNDILLICKELDPVDNNEPTEGNSEEINEMKEKDNKPKSQIKYKLIAVLRINSLFLVDPSDSIENLDTNQAHEYVDNKLEIVEVGAAIHRIIFSSVNEKLLWKNHLSRSLSEVTPIYSVFDQAKLYRYLLAQNENTSYLDDINWPHNLCLSSLPENSGYYVNINQRNVHDDINILRNEMINMRDYFDKKISGIKENRLSDNVIPQQESSLKHNDHEKMADEITSFRNQLKKLTKELDEERQKYKEIELKYELLMKEMKNIEENAVKREQETQSYIQKLGLEIINQRKQFSKEVEKVMELLGTHQTRHITPTVTPEKTIRNKSPRVSQKKLTHLDSSPAEQVENIPDKTPGKIIVSVSPRRSNASSVNYESVKENKSKPIRLKNTIFTQDDNSKSFKNKILNFGGSKKKESPPSHWRKLPVNNDLNGSFTLKKPKKVDWGRIKGENYLSDDFTSDADFGNTFIVVSDFSKNDHTNVRKSYLSDCSEEEEYKSGVSQGKSEIVMEAERSRQN